MVAAVVRAVLLALLAVGLLVAIVTPSASAATFANTNAISLPATGAANPYPSHVTVYGLGGTITDVNVVLDGITHVYPDDIDVLLVGPYGQKVVLMADCGGAYPLVDVSLLYDDQSAYYLPNDTQIVYGGYRPTVAPGGFFDDWLPAPAGPYGATLAMFNGTDPNGDWELFVVDDTVSDSGTIGGGWRLEILTNGPTVTGFSPIGGPPGTIVYIYGANFTGVTSVTFGGVAASDFEVAGTTTIHAAVPTGAVTGKVAVTTMAGTATSTDTFSVKALPPTITGFSPMSGLPGTLVWINGFNFTNVTSVTFGGVAASDFGVTSPNLIETTVPTDAVTGKIGVTTVAGTATSTGTFTVTAPAPTIASFSPTSGPVGTPVVITGTNFTGVTSVRFGGVVATTFTVNSATQITATVPTGAVTGPISVTTAGGTATSAASFTVSLPLPAPTITAFSPTSGHVWTVVVINGTNFTGVTSVTFGGVTATAFTVNSVMEITATVPTGAVTGPISVTTAAGTATSATVFTVAGPITVEAPSPATVKRGKVATLKFRVNEPVLGGVAAVTIRIERFSTVVKTLRVAEAPMNSLQKAGFTCRLAKGTYRFYVSASMRGGIEAINTASNTLKVK